MDDSAVAEPRSRNVASSVRSSDRRHAAGVPIWGRSAGSHFDPVVEAKRRADRGTSVLDQLTLAELIRSGHLDRHIRRTRLRYRRRRDELAHFVADHADGARLLGIAAGLHAALSLPHQPLDEAQLLDALARHSIALTTLTPYWHRPPEAPQPLVVGYGTPPQHAWPQALRRLSRSLRELVPPTPLIQGE